MNNPKNAEECDRLNLNQRRALVAKEMERVSRAEHLQELVGTLGADLLGVH
jgi:hypothetical protein